jgi:hypothetical protein
MWWQGGLGIFFFLTLYDFLIQNGDYGGYLKEIFQPLLFLFFFGHTSAFQDNIFQGKKEELMDGTKGRSFFYKFQIRL